MTEEEKDLINLKMAISPKLYVKELIKENQELKKQLQIKHDGFMASTDELCEYAVENDKLKKQLENSSKINVADHKYASECEDKVIILKTQQKEFIKYLEDEIILFKELDKRYPTEIVVAHKNALLLIEKYENILQKYKEIIGDEKE